MSNPETGIEASPPDKDHDTLDQERNRSFLRELAELRKSQGITQNELVRRWKRINRRSITQGGISDIENGVTTPMPSTVEAYARALGETVCYVLRVDGLDLIVHSFEPPTVHTNSLNRSPWGPATFTMETMGTLEINEADYAFLDNTYNQ